MGFLISVLTVVHVLSCIILVVVVLMHESKGDSLASVFGGGGVDSAFGVQFGKKVSRFTGGAAVVFMSLAIVIGILNFNYGRGATVLNTPTPGPGASSTTTPGTGTAPATPDPGASTGAAPGSTGTTGG